MTNTIELIQKSDVIYGETNWYWPKEDEGGWTGPMKDWDDNQTKYFTHVRNFGTIVAAGGCCGMYPRFYSKKFKRVIVFEPSPFNFFCLVMNCPQDNVHKFQCALGETGGSVEVNYREIKNVGTHHVVSNKGTDVKNGIPMMNIDSLCLNECDMIQLDVEGYEAPVIRGARQTIERFRPVIVVERGGGYKESSEELKKLKYVEIARSGHADSVYAPEEFKQALR